MKMSNENIIASILFPFLILVAVGLSILGNAPQRLPYSPDSDLTRAAYAGDLAKVQALLAKGADANTKDPGGAGWTPLHYAAAMGHEAVVAFLLEKGVNANIKAANGDTPLHATGMMVPGQKCVEILLKKGAQVNAQNNEGKTALQHYITEGHYIESPAVDQLLEAGADPTIVDKTGHSPYLDAKKWNPQVQEKLERYIKKK